MDSKMDSGYIAPGENQVQALEDDYDVRQALTPEQVIGLMDQLLCHEVRLFVVPVVTSTEEIIIADMNFR